MTRFIFRQASFLGFSFENFEGEIDFFSFLSSNSLSALNLKGSHHILKSPFPEMDSTET